MKKKAGMPAGKRVLFIGDIVGEPGRLALERNLKSLCQKEQIDFVIANGENSSGGFGMTRRSFEALREVGIDAFTMGNHIFDKKELVGLLEEETCIVRPFNLPGDFPGVGYRVFTLGSERLLLINLLGQIFMSSATCPFAAIDSIIGKTDEHMSGLKEEDRKEESIDYILVDIHAEATSEKLAMGWYLDGRVSAVMGTHTHVQTSDARILPCGTAYITDAGMTGPRDSVLGMDKDAVLQRFVQKRSAKLFPAHGDLQINAVIVELVSRNRSRSIELCNLTDCML